MSKKIFIGLVMLCGLLPLQADDNLLQNGDFSEGTVHWHGNLRSPADFASDNPLQAADPFTSKGMIIPLKHGSWCKVEQDFKGKVSNVDLSITYMISPDFEFSPKPDDYKNIPSQLGWGGWRAFDTAPGNWIVFVSDFGSAHGTYWQIQPKLGSSNPQTIKTHLSGLTPYEDKTIALAVPPGKGSMVILNVSITGK